jgi:integrase
MSGNITKRSKNSWQIRFDAAPVADGKRQRRHVTVRGSYADAKRELTRLLAARDTGMLPSPTAATVGQYLQSWLDTATGRSPKTLERYRELARWQISPHLGDVPLQKLSPEMVRHWHAKLIDKVSALTTRHAHRLLRQVLATAVKDGTLARNVADVHKPPKVKRSEVEILTFEQIAAVQDALQGHTLYPIVALALGTGMRRGELLAIQWGDIDLDSATLQVKRSLEETSAGLRLKEPKSDAGWRTVTLSAATVGMLRAHKIEQMQFRLAVGAGALKDDTLVFTDINGQPLKPHTVSRAWRRVVEAKDLPRVTFHSLRHTHASVLIASGLDILTISRRIGHAKPSVTLDVYGHLMGGADAACAVAIGKILK